MPLISISVDEVRRAATKVKDIAVGLSRLPVLDISDRPDLSLAIAEFVACMNDCRSERERELDALSAGLREVVDRFESHESRAVDEICALGSTVEWSIR